MKIIIEEDKTYNEISEVEKDTILVCKSGVSSEHPLGFSYIVFNNNNELKGKFISIDDAIEYARFLSTK